MKRRHSCPFLSVCFLKGVASKMRRLNLRIFESGPGACVGKPLAMLGEFQNSASKDLAF